jgi:hypothetical protein
MRRHWQLVKMALRAATWRATAEPPAIGLPGLAVWVAIEVAVFVAIDYSPQARFTEYGLGLTIGCLVVVLAAGALVLRPERRIDVCAALTTLSILMLAALEAVFAGGDRLLTASGATQSMRVGAGVFASGVYVIWVLGAFAAVLRSFQADMRWHGWSRAAAVLVLQVIAGAAYPLYPAFSTRETRDNPPNLWSIARELLNPREEREEPKRVDGARVELAQPELMEAAIARLAPQTPGQADIYAIGIAGWAEQDVFIKELDGALAAVDRVLAVRGRTLRLVNHADTVERTPVAMRANFAAAVRAVGRAMNRDEDVLLLFMTSHGTTDGIALGLPGLISNYLAPEDVARVLDREGIRNRIVIVSACYGGVFVPPLANDDTIVLTAADEKSTSFGCSNEREWTYFGDALFNHGLRPEVSLEEAFRAARETIAQWEARDGLQPSNPQAHFGPALTARLATVYGASRRAERRPVP